MIRCTSFSFLYFYSSRVVYINRYEKVLRFLIPIYLQVDVTPHEYRMYVAVCYPATTKGCEMSDRQVKVRVATTLS